MAPQDRTSGHERGKHRLSALLRSSCQWCVRHWVPLAFALLAILVAIGYLVTTLDMAGSMGFPFDDSYIYLTYAKQIGRGQPFSYYDGGGFSAGATSPLWPAIIAPLWTIGFRGYAFVFAAFTACALLLAGCAAVTVQLGKRSMGMGGGILAAVLICSCAAFTYAGLAAMEVALAAFLLLATALKLMTEGDREQPSRLLLALLGATALARPELSVVVGLVMAGNFLQQCGRRRFRVAALWCLPYVPLVLWMICNRIFAGQFSPNTAVVKSHVHLPGFDWTYFVAVFKKQFGNMFGTLWWSDKSPLWGVRLLSVLWVVGAGRLLWWARCHQRWSAAFVLIATPMLVTTTVVATSGQWTFHNYRYISYAFPAFFVVVGLSLAAFPIPKRAPSWLTRLTWLPAAVLACVVAWTSYAPLRAEMRYFGQGARDTNAHVVKIGRWIDNNLPADAHVAFHDAGAIGYYSNRRVTDILGLVTNGNARHANNGPGSRFERLERLPIQDRPTHIAYYPGWLGNFEFYGENLLKTPLPRNLTPKRPRLVGSSNMHVYVMIWDAVGTGHKPLAHHADWELVDSVDVADLVDESNHAYHADQGRRSLLSPTATWSFYHKSKQSDGRLVSDGGRTIRGPQGERFSLSVRPNAPVLLLMRTGGKDHRISRTPPSGTTLTVHTNETLLGHYTVPPQSTHFHDLQLSIPAKHVQSDTLNISISKPNNHRYRSFHYFALQPVD